MLGCDYKAFSIEKRKMKQYKVLANKKIYEKASLYLEKLQAGRSAGNYLQEKLQGKEISHISVEEFLELLIRTKRPQIFAESAVAGNGSDWSNEEISMLGDIGIAAPVTVYDNGRHVNPDIHESPLNATLLFIPGALLRNGKNNIPADWNEVTRNGEINPETYYSLYERRLLPLFLYANQVAKNKEKMAFITIPCLGYESICRKVYGAIGS